jgi:hypothetical protein
MRSLQREGGRRIYACRSGLASTAASGSAQIANRTGTRVLAEVPGTYEELVAAWDERGIDFQRRLIEALVHSIIVKPATTRRPSTPVA